MIDRMILEIVKVMEQNQYRLEAKLDWLAAALKQVPDVWEATQPTWRKISDKEIVHDGLPTLPPYPEKP